MKAYKKLFALLPLTAIFIVACNDLEDRDYFDNTGKTNENVEVVSVDQTSVNYIEAREDLTSMAELFQKTGVLAEMEKKGTLHTIFVVVDSIYQVPEAARDTFIAKSHITDVAVSPSKLHNGDRLLMWHDKYVKVAKDAEAEQGNIINHIHFNNASLQEVISTKDGYIYVISEMINTPQSLEDYINALDDAQYSVFKEMVLSSGGKVFDRANSKIIGVDDRGNTLYDTAWIYSNDFFDAKNFSLSSESLTATMLTFSNGVIDDAMERADSTLRAWGYRSGVAGSADYIEGRSDSILRRWILEVAFFNQSYSVEDLTPKAGEDESVNDFKSIYDRQWRTSQQTLDLVNPVQLSNGIAYDVKRLRIPNNVLIYRLKENFYYYEYCTDEEKNTYFKMDNLAFSECNNEVDAWTPLAGVWPMHGNRTLVLKQVDTNNKTFNLDFTPLQAISDGSGAYAVKPVMVPPGTYRLAMGFKQNLNVTMDISLCSVIGPDTTVLATNNKVLTDGTVGTAFHCDRGATLSNTYPEGYNPKDPSVSSHNKAGNYDTDGGLVLQEVKIDDPGDGSAVQVLIRIHAADVGSVSKYVFNHWCLRPTTNNY